MNNNVEDKERYQLDPNRWVDTLPQNKKKTKSFPPKRFKNKFEFWFKDLRFQKD